MQNICRFRYAHSMVRELSANLRTVDEDVRADLPTVARWEFYLLDIDYRL